MYNRTIKKTSLSRRRGRCGGGGDIETMRRGGARIRDGGKGDMEGGRAVTA
jgi:hypothetical protein